ncbi:uncharacterized protein HD556DRAFT_1284518 [Suillus plorans]|uniref:SEC7 domain-containing protein n=1 Tax=Suillus plorans TaxID=116603 RepID=A0A9P7DTL2_9AGAM|nr:uncharacterized protein HD556DRAFT_1284518 [Suillus plorans]KAG1802736.1 hypothetical protein HD556DRAFT_1284518 [Suillus plorans]
MENDPGSVAEQRANAVAKLKRAASLPRLKNGRRPQMHNEVVSEGEKTLHDDVQDPSQDTPPECVSNSDYKPIAQPEENPGSPEPSNVNRKRRSRSRSRSRGSKDLRKFKPPQSPLPTSVTPSNDSSPDDSPPSRAEYLPHSILAPIPSHLNPLPNSPFILPGFLTAESPFLPSGASSPIPRFPTLEALVSRQGLQRSNSAGAARMLTLQSTLQKLTGGTELMESTFPSPAMSPPPSGTKLGRNNTVSGGESSERSTARRLMMAQLNKRMIKETDIEEEDPRPFSPSKRRQRRRSKRQSANRPVVSTTDESDLVSTNDATPNRSNTPQTQPDELAPNVQRTSSSTPIPPIPIYPLATPSINLNETINSSRQSTPVRAVPPTHFDHAAKKRRESVLIEDPDDEDRIPPQSTYYGLPGAPSRPHPSLSPRLPHSSDVSTDSPLLDVTNVPIFLAPHLERTPSRQARFPSSPFARPHKEISLSSDQEEERDQEEEEFFPTEAFRRSPYHDGLNREISWVAEPVPETPMPVHEETEEEEDDELLQDEPAQQITEDEDDHPPPDSPREGFNTQIEEPSSRASSDSKELVVELETSPLPTPALTSPTPSSFANLPNTASMLRNSDESDSQQYPQRLSVAIRMHSDKSPVVTEPESTDPQTVRAETPSRREGSTWSKIVHSLTRSASSSGRRSRTNSIATRERRQHTDSSISRESGVSLPSPKIDKNDSISSTTYPHGQPSSASTSVHSLVQTAPPSSGVSPVPMTPSTDPLAKYTHEKLMPFPGIKKLQEQWNRQPHFSSTPDIILSHHVEADIPLPSSSSSNTPSNSPEINGDRKLTHQASDTHLLHIYKAQAPPLSASASTSSHDHYQHGSPHSPSSIMLKSLPTNRDGVRRWLSARKLFPQPSQSPVGNSPPTPSPEPKPAVASKKPSLSDLFRLRKENDLSAELQDEWVDVDRDKSRSSVGNGQLKKANGEFSPTSPNDSFIRDELQKTPRASKIARPNGQPYSATDISLIPLTPATPSPPEFPSTTPEPWSSLSDYPHLTTSESSSSNTSSHYSNYPAKGGILLERLNDMLGRGSRSPVWLSAIDEPPRRFLRCSPVFQVVNSNICKDRFLFLFNDILVIAKPRAEDSDTFLEVTKPNPADRKFTVKNVVLLRQLCFTSEREEPCSRAIPRTPAVQAFVEQFSIDPDNAVTLLFSSLDHRDDPAALAQLLFRTPHIDRVQLGDFLSRRTSRVVLKHYLDAFGFMGMRVDKALRLFLQSIHIPERGSHGITPLDVLLEPFANRWYEANAIHISYDKDLAYRFTRAIVQLNDVLHGAISHEPGQMGHPKRNITARDFLEAFRRHDNRLSDELLGDVYDSIRRERLCQARNSTSGGPPEITVTFKRTLPPRLTYRVQSEPVVIRIPQPDPQFSIELFGHDLVFDPPVLSFAKSAEASFRVTGRAFGLKTMSMLRSGPNALLYAGLAQSYTIAVERAFMRNTFQVAFLDHNGAKRKYMFSVTDPVVRHEWAVSLKREIDASVVAADHPYGINWPSPQTARFYKASYNMSFKVLQDTLLKPSASLGDTSPFPSKVDHALARLTSSGLHARDQSKTSVRLGVNCTSEPVRSKSRSKVYHRHGPGKMESEGNTLGFPHESSDDCGDDPDTQLRSDDQYWSGKDLAMYCQQNSSIALLLAYLQVSTPDVNGSQ